MDAAKHSLSSVLQNYSRLIPVEWLVGVLLLISMTLQLVLVLLGARRYHCSAAIFHFVVWGAYISADAVAISALGTMMYSARSGIYGIWAPVLLLHLGGPDAITAYSTADNELWLRHGFNMVYQVSVAVYVIYSSALKGRALVSALFLLVSGATKYGERTLALWLASYSQIVRSCLPISKYLKEKKDVVDRDYVVMGEKQLHKIVGKSLRESSKEESGGKVEVEEGRDKEVAPERKDIEGALVVPSPEGKGIVTMKNLQDSGISEEDYNLCLSHALFKMYMRRFVSLYLVEGDWKETRRFWHNFDGKKAFKIVEMELKFMYDALFSKGCRTAFSRFGISLRLLNCVLMGAAGFLILRETQYGEIEQRVTYGVVSVALAVEVFQFCRIMISDWTRVRLICAQVEVTSHPIFSKAIKIAVLLLGKAQNVVRGDSGWSNGIHQHCLLGTWLKRRRFAVWKVAKFLAKVDIYLATWYVRKEFFEDGLKVFIFDILKRKCDPEVDNETCKDGIYYFEEDLLEGESAISDVMLGHENLEEVILVWHIATTICDSQERESGGGRGGGGSGIAEDDNNNNNVQWSLTLSKYCAYLIVSYPRLLPVHPDTARFTYMQLVEELMGKVYYGENYCQLLKCSDKGVLGSAEALALKLLEKEKRARWKLLAEYWAGLVIYVAVYNKATVHAECVAGGGEFLSQIWGLLGHMGVGEQSDSAVRKKIESSMQTERRERRRIQQERRRERERERELSEELSLAIALQVLERERERLRWGVGAGAPRTRP